MPNDEYGVLKYEINNWHQQGYGRVSKLQKTIEWAQVREGI